MLNFGGIKTLSIISLEPIKGELKSFGLAIKQLVSLHQTVVSTALALSNTGNHRYVYLFTLYQDIILLSQHYIDLCKATIKYSQSLSVHIDVHKIMSLMHLIISRTRHTLDLLHLHVRSNSGKQCSSSHSIHSKFKRTYIIEK